MYLLCRFHLLSSPLLPSTLRSFPSCLACLVGLWSLSSHQSHPYPRSVCKTPSSRPLFPPSSLLAPLLLLLSWDLGASRSSIISLRPALNSNNSTHSSPCADFSLLLFPLFLLLLLLSLSFHSRLLLSAGRNLPPSIHHHPPNSIISRLPPRDTRIPIETTSLLLSSTHTTSGPFLPHTASHVTWPVKGSF